MFAAQVTRKVYSEVHVPQRRTPKYIASYYCLGQAKNEPRFIRVECIFEIQDKLFNPSHRSALAILNGLPFPSHRPYTLPLHPGEHMSFPVGRTDN